MLIDNQFALARKRTVPLPNLAPNLSTATYHRGAAQSLQTTPVEGLDCSLLSVL